MPQCPPIHIHASLHANTQIRSAQPAAVAARCTLVSVGFACWRYRLSAAANKRAQRAPPPPQREAQSPQLPSPHKRETDSRNSHGQKNRSKALMLGAAVSLVALLAVAASASVCDLTGDWVVNTRLDTGGSVPGSNGVGLKSQTDAATASST